MDKNEENDYTLPTNNRKSTYFSAFMQILTNHSEQTNFIKVKRNLKYLSKWNVVRILALPFHCPKCNSWGRTRIVSKLRTRDVKKQKYCCQNYNQIFFQFKMKLDICFTNNNLLSIMLKWGYVFKAMFLKLLTLLPTKIFKILLLLTNFSSNYNYGKLLRAIETTKAQSSLISVNSLRNDRFEFDFCKSIEQSQYIRGQVNLWQPIEICITAHYKKNQIHN